MNIPIPDPETIALLQSFGYGMAQNLLASAIVEWKKIKDDRLAQENAAWLENREHAKPLEGRIGQTICEALRSLNLSNQQFQLVLPLASDPLFGGELAKQILTDTCSGATVKNLILQCSPAAEALVVEVDQFSSLLLAAIQSAIADDSHLHRVKQLHFQASITAQVAEVKAETAKTQEAIRTTGQTVVGEIQELSALVRQKLLSDSTAEFEVREKIYHARIEQARKLMESGKPKTAQRLLEELRSELSHLNPSKALLFRIATNIGACAIQLDDQETGIREIDLAFQLDPENPKAIANASMTTLLKGRAEDALALAERARELLPKDSVPTANYVQALFALNREAGLDDLLKHEDWILKDANCCFVIGTLLFNRSRFSDAEKFFRSGLEADPSEPRLLTHLAHSLVRPMQAALLGEPVLDWKFPPDAKPRLNEAESLLDQAIVVQTDSEDRRFFAFTHVLRADVRRMLGKESAAIADCEVALHENRSDESPLPIKALAQLHAGLLHELQRCAHWG